MLEVIRLKRKGIHDVFDGDIENSYQVKRGEDVLGWVCFHPSLQDAQTIWVEFILAKHRGAGDGESMLHALFELGYEKIEGTAIYGPHFFWESVGAEFSDEVEEDIFDGTYFTLTKEGFYKRNKPSV